MAQPCARKRRVPGRLGLKGEAMELFSVEGNPQRLDGGSMFGNCPRAVWERWCPADDQHRIDLACRCLLIRESSGRTVLLETGIGAFFPPKLRERYGVRDAHHVLLASLADHGLQPEDIDVVVLSHLHFDHAGGALTAFVDGAEPALVFSRAAYVVGQSHYERAQAPHPRDRASFIPELPALLRATGKLEVVAADAATSKTLGPMYRLLYSNGHTPGLMLSQVTTPQGRVTFASDLIPGTPWVHVPITMGYDRFPELLIDEKEALLERVVEDEGWLFYTHDPHVAASRVARDDRGRYRAVDVLSTVAWRHRDAEGH